MNVTQAMISHPKTHLIGTTIRQAREFFHDDHVHALLIVDRGILVAVVEREDLTGHPLGILAHKVGYLDGRTITAGADLASARSKMVTRNRRRLAVVDAEGRIHGLLCLKRSGRGFCSDEDVRARTIDQHNPVTAQYPGDRVESAHD